MKLLVALYQRPHITELCFQGIKRLQQSFDIDPICIYSDTDNKNIVDQYGFEGYRFKNDQLGRKLNFGIERALESEWDYIMHIGSDDIISDDLIRLYQPLMKEGKRAFGINTVHFYNMLSGEAAVSVNPYAYGCARVLKRSVLSPKYLYRIKILKGLAGKDFMHPKGAEITVTEEKANGFIKPGYAELIEKIDVNMPLWTNEKNRSLDYDSHIRLHKMGVQIETIQTKGVMCVDLKSEVNIWNFDYYDKVDFDVLEKIPEKDAIRKVRQEYYDTVLH